jgi:hypothetical protein
MECVVKQPAENPAVVRRRQFPRVVARRRKFLRDVAAALLHKLKERFGPDLQDNMRLQVFERCGIWLPNPLTIPISMPFPNVQLLFPRAIQFEDDPPQLVFVEKSILYGFHISSIQGFRATIQIDLRDSFTDMLDPLKTELTRERKRRGIKRALPKFDFDLKRMEEAYESAFLDFKPLKATQDKRYARKLDDFVAQVLP